MGGRSADLSILPAFLEVRGERAQVGGRRGDVLRLSNQEVAEEMRFQWLLPRISCELKRHKSKESNDRGL